jgi:hypothetical protein
MDFSEVIGNAYLADLLRVSVLDLKHVLVGSHAA